MQELSEIMGSPLAVCYTEPMLSLCDFLSNELGRENKYKYYLIKNKNNV